MTTLDEAAAAYRTALAGLADARAEQDRARERHAAAERDVAAARERRAAASEAANKALEGLMRAAGPEHDPNMVWL